MAAHPPFRIGGRRDGHRRPLEIGLGLSHADWLVAWSLLSARAARPASRATAAPDRTAAPLLRRNRRREATIRPAWPMPDEAPVTRAIRSFELIHVFLAPRLYMMVIIIE